MNNYYWYFDLINNISKMSFKMINYRFKIIMYKANKQVNKYFNMSKIS